MPFAKLIPVKDMSIKMPKAFVLMFTPEAKINWYKNFSFLIKKSYAKRGFKKTNSSPTTSTTTGS
jgi:hypothetical protein